MATGKIIVQGFQSSRDAERISNALQAVWGIRDVTLQPESGEVTVSYDERSSSFEDFEQAVVDCGYGIVDEGGRIG